MDMNARPYILHEASLAQLKALAPNVAVLPWGATEGHNFHLPHGTDVIEANALGQAAVARANAAGARCVLLPAIPFGNDNQQLTQVATITMRTSTQHAVLRDVAQSLTAQGINRLIVLNFHGGNEFKGIIRDVMLDVPIFILRMDGYALADYAHLLHTPPDGHADEFETSLMLHLTPDWVDMAAAGNGATTPYALKSLKGPGLWTPRNWAALTRDTGDGDPHQATAEAGAKIFELLVAAATKVFVELSAAKEGDFPFCLAKKS